jgi:hypothetical protein
MADFPQLLHTVLDTTDVRGLAEFYRQCSIERPGPRLMCRCRSVRPSVLHLRAVNWPGDEAVDVGVDLRGDALEQDGELVELDVPAVTVLLETGATVHRAAGERFEA